MNARSRFLVAVVIFVALAAGRASADPLTLSFTAGDVKSIMVGYGDRLSNDTHQWGLWTIRAMPIVTGGTFDILTATVAAETEWWSARPSTSEFAYPYAETALFFAEPGSEHLGVAAHPLSLIADQPADTFQSYAFDNSVESSPGRSTFIGVCSGDLSAPGCNQARTLLDSTLFSFSFDLGAGASWIGWQFLVDGSMYYRPGEGVPENRWVMDFNGGYGWLDPAIFGQDVNGGGLEHNVAAGYQVLFPVPEPGTLGLLALGLAGAGAMARRWRRR